MVPFAMLLGLTGLSQREAADFLDARLDTVKSWSSGRNRCPDGVIEDLSDLAERQERAADEAINAITEAPEGADVEIGYPVDDVEAQALGWPCVGAWKGMAARVVAFSDKPVRLVPRGSTLATAGSADANE